MASHRDLIISEIYERALLDPSIYFLSVDFGAPALDIFRERLPSQFIHVGISEQNAIDLAAGLSLAGNKVFVYGMAPFISLRCIEQIKMSLCQMKLPVVVLSVGVGLGYADSGPTHYATEDCGVLRSIVGLDVYDISTPAIAAVGISAMLQSADHMPTFFRLDREGLPELHDDFCSLDWFKGYKFIRRTESCNLVVASGKALHTAQELRSSEAVDFDLVDLFNRKHLDRNLVNDFASYSKIVFMDEQTYCSTSFGFFLQEVHRINPGLLRSKEFYSLGLSEGYFYENGGRSYLHQKDSFSARALMEVLQRG
jgi:transketolase